MIRRTATRSAAVVLALTLMAGAARSQEPALDAQVIDTRANEMYDQIMSPFCPGRTLANCPSPQAAAMRERVKQQLAAGMSQDEIVDSLYGIYGEIILGAPELAPEEQARLDAELSEL